MIDQLLEIFKNTNGIFTAFVLDKNNEFSTFDEEKFHEDTIQVELIETILPTLHTLREYQSLNISLCSFEYDKHTCNIYLTANLTLAVIYENSGEFEEIEPIVKEILESI